MNHRRSPSGTRDVLLDPVRVMSDAWAAIASRTAAHHRTGQAEDLMSAKSARAEAAKALTAWSNAQMPGCVESAIQPRRRPWQTRQRQVHIAKSGAAVTPASILSRLT